MALEGVYFVIIVNAPEASAQFLNNHFGFTEMANLGWYIHLSHPIGAEIAFMAPNLENQPQPYRVALSGAGAIMTIEVNDVDSELERLSARNIDIAQPIVTEEWGQRHFGIVDPNGLMIDVVQAVSKEQ